MKTRRKRCLKGATDKVVHKVMIKQEKESLAEDSCASDLANQQMAVNMESLRPIRIVEVPSLVQQFSTDLQTPADDNEGTKTELTSDEEFIDEKNDSTSGSSTHTKNQPSLAPAHSQMASASISDKESEPSEFSSRNDFRKQLRLEPTLKCEFCPRTFKQKYVLKKHLSDHAKDRKQQFACDLCERTFCNQFSLKRHKNVHITLNRVTFPCEVCGSSFTEKSNLKEHMVRKHLDESQPTTRGPQKVDVSKNCQPKNLVDEGAASCAQDSPERAGQDCESKSDMESEACEVCHNIYPKGLIRTHMRLAHYKWTPRSAGTFECDLCWRSFKTKELLKLHLDTHTKAGKQEFACDLCERTFYNQFSLNRHKKLHTATPVDRSTVTCKVCGSSLSQKSHLKVHMLLKHLDKVQSITPRPETANDDSIKTHTKEFLDEAVASSSEKSRECVLQGSESTSDMKSEACKVCHCIFPTEYIRTHMRLTHNKPKYKCKFCWRSLKNEHNLTLHLNNHAKDKERKFACDSCGKTFSSKYLLKSHQRVHTAQLMDSTFNCEVCGASFTQKGSLKIHMLRKHLDKAQSNTPSNQTAAKDSSSQREEVLDEETASQESTAQANESKSDTNSKACEVCHCIYPTEYMRMHMRLAHSKPKYKCEFCLRSFKQRRYFIAHRNNHIKERKREFTCETCERSFFYKSTLTRHKKLHCTKFISSTFICKVCGASFTENRKLKSHMRSKHLNKAQSITPGPQMADDDSTKTNWILKNNQCGVCFRFFKTKSILWRHLGTHSKDGKRDFACDMCGKTFYTKRSLWDHKKIHTLDEYHCKVCGKRFTQKESLKVHMLQRQHFDETHHFTPQPSNDVGVPIKTELTSDEEEEFIDEGKNRNSVFQAVESQQPALLPDDKQRGGEDSVSCEVCHNGYPAELIETHMRITHGDGTYKCQFCPKVCLRKADLERHLKSHDDNRTRPYACEQCGYMFLAKASLKRHVATQHTKNRLPEFNCELCEKKFYTKVAYERHKRTHTEDAISCGVCGVRFTEEKILKHHMVRKHTSKTQQVTPDPPTKEELILDEELSGEETWQHHQSQLPLVH